MPSNQDNIALTIAYDGTDFFGWQKTKMGKSIEEEIEKALFILLKEKKKLQAASRTDRGVHARGQVVNLFMESSVDIKRLQKSLNALLSKDIVIVDIKKMNASFHPTLDSTGKKYCYYICSSNILLPHLKRFVWHYPHELDPKKMREAAKALIGEHDFSSFCNIRTKNCIRKLFGLEIIPYGEKYYRIEIEGNNFLYKMVRTIVGTLVYIGEGRLKSISQILKKRERKEAGVTAPACGLFLEKVFYDFKE